MASLSMDSAKPPVFFGDRGDLAWAIGAPIRNEEAAQKAVQEVIKELRRDGAIVWSGQARAGVKASYALALEFEHTWLPVGAGRNIEWQKIARTEIPAGMQSKDIAGVIPNQGEEISPPGQMQTPKISPPKGEEIAGPKGEEIPPSRGRNSLPPTTSNSNPYFNQSIQSAAPYVTKEPARAREAVDNANALIGNLSFEDEKARQSAALQKLIAAEQKEAS